MIPDVPAGTIRHNANLKLVAMRTELPEPRSWFVGTVDQGGHYDGAAAVAGEGWAELYQPA